VLTVALEPGYSTTNLVEKILERAAGPLGGIGQIEMDN